MINKMQILNFDNLKTNDKVIMYGKTYIFIKTGKDCLGYERCEKCTFLDKKTMNCQIVLPCKNGYWKLKEVKK